MAIHKTLIVLLSAGLVGCSPSLSVEEKACLTAASRLLQMAGAGSQNVSSASPLQAPDAAKRIVGSYYNPEQAREETLQTFSFLGDSDNEDIKRMVAQGRREKAEERLTELLGKWISAGAILDVDATSAGVGSTYRFACGWDATGKVIAAPLGMVR
ncbi:hypothetical protein ACUXK4_004886 [Methylorubrum extorquens]